MRQYHLISWGLAMTRKSLILTPREAQIYRLVLRGKSNKDIASVLGIAPRTVSSTSSISYENAAVLTDWS